MLLAQVTLAGSKAWQDTNPCHVVENGSVIDLDTFQEPVILTTLGRTKLQHLTRPGMQDFKRQPLKVGCFHFPPFTVIAEAEGEKLYSGVEVTLADEIAGLLGLELEFHPPSDGKVWGAVYKNGTSDGLLGDVIRGEVDVGMAEFFYNRHRMRLSLASDFYVFEHLCFVRRKPAPMPHWKSILMPFTKDVWGACFLGLAASTLFIILHDFVTMRRMSIDWALLNSLGFFLAQSLGARGKR